MHPVIQKRQQASGSLPKASKVREKVPGLARAGAPPGGPGSVADASIKHTGIRNIRFIHLGDDRPSAARTSVSRAHAPSRT